MGPAADLLAPKEAERLGESMRTRGDVILLSNIKNQCEIIMRCRFRHRRRFSVKRETIISMRNSLAIIAISVAITMSLFTHFSQASLIRIYHRHKPTTSSLLGQTGDTQEPINALEDGASSAASLINQTLSQLSGGGNLETLNRRAATIEFNSPMKRIMDLIGQHAPVIVVDSSGQEAQPPAAPSQANSVNLPAASNGQALQATTAFSSPLSSPQPLFGQPQLQAQQQQQHWTILDTSQLMAQQSGNHHQQQQQVPASVPNEQYFTFTPFGLAPTANPFAQTNTLIAQSNPFLLQQQQQQQQQPTLNQQQQQQQMTQSSQNYQQQQQAGAPTMLLDGANQVQPVFLSSYVPELPLPPGQTFMPQVQQQQPQTSQQAPDSIQQQIKQNHTKEKKKKMMNDETQAERAPDSDSKSDNEGEDLDEKNFSGGGSRKQEDDDGPNESSGSNSDEPPSDEDTGRGSSGSSSFEDKYDSDRDEQQQRPTTNHASQQEAASSSGSLNSNNYVNGLRDVGLNDDCLQCICRASSGCDQHLKCITLGAEDKFCGPFQLTEEYWQRASQPGDSPNNFSSFEDCANDVDCAVETVTNYMRKYIRDCDGDQNVTCLDYARLHRLKPNECDNTSQLHNQFEGYWQKFQRCAEGYHKMRNGDNEDI